MFNRGKTSLPYLFLGPSLLVMLVLGWCRRWRRSTWLKNRVRDPGQRLRLAAQYRAADVGPALLNAIEVSAIWEVVTVLGAVVAGILIAIYLFENVHGKWRQAMCVLLITPVLLPRVSAAFIWKFMYSPLTGILGWLLGLVGIHDTAFLSDPLLALYAVAADIWVGIVLRRDRLKLLETLPPEPLEAARLDHARTWQVCLHRPADAEGPLISLVFIKMVESLRSFDLIYVMTKGGPGVATETLDMYAYAQGIGLSGKVSYASTMAVLMMVATTLIFTLIWKRVSKWED
jgi:multiple sugar transport system permease protein